MPYFDRKDELNLITFVGGSQGTRSTHEHCVENFAKFIDKHGRREQWHLADVESVNRELWRAALLKWGYPVWSYQGPSQSAP